MATKSDNRIGKDVKVEPSEILFMEDILEVIFSHLNLEDLYRVISVCQFWKRIANYEISRRNVIRCLTLSEFSDGQFDSVSGGENDVKENYDDYAWNLNDKIKSQTLILLNDNSKILKNRIKYYEPRPEIFNLIGLQTKCTLHYKTAESESNSLLGVSVPCTNKLKVDCFFSNVDYDDLNYDKYFWIVVDRMAKEFEEKIFNSEEEHQCIMYFDVPEYKGEECESFHRMVHIRSKFFKVIKSRCKTGSYTLWGGSINKILLNDYNSLIFVMRISGPSAIQSWSIVIDENSTESRTRKQLLKLKRSINLKIDSIAFAMSAPENREIQNLHASRYEIFLEIFPNVPLVSMFGHDEKSVFQYGISSLSHDSDQPFQHKNSTSFLIITHSR